MTPSFISERLGIEPLGDDVSANPLDIYTENDPKLTEPYNKLQDLAFSEGALQQKFKALTAMAINVEHGALQGATTLGRRDLKPDATKDEITETLRASYHVGGNRALPTSVQVPQNLFKQGQKPLRALNVPWIIIPLYPKRQARWENNLERNI